MVRVMAARSLYRIKSTRDIALPVLVEGLRDEDKRVRRLADSTLRMWDSIIRTGEPLENAVPALIEVLRDEEDKSVLVRGWSVRDIVARTLWEIGTPEAIEAVEEYDKSR